MDIENLAEKILLGEKTIDVQGLWGASRAFVMASLSLIIKKPIVFISFSEDEAEAFAHDFSFFYNELLLLYKNKKKIAGNIRLFPSWEILPYESIAPDADVCGKRLGMLDSLVNGEVFSVSTTVKAMLQRLIPKKALGESAELLLEHDSFELVELKRSLLAGGYKIVDMIENKGDFCIRGSVIEVFCPNMEDPIRAEFSLDSIGFIRTFDVETQRSKERIPELTILPARETVLSRKNLARLQDNLEKKHSLEPEESGAVVAALREGGKLFSPEPYLSYLYPETATLFDYISKDAVFVYDEWQMLEKEGIEFEKLVEKEYKNLSKTHLPTPEENYISFNKFKKFSKSPSINIVSLKSSSRKSASTFFFDVKNNEIPALHLLGKSARSEYFKKISGKFQEWQGSGMNIVILAENAIQRDATQEMLMDIDIDAASCGSCSEVVGKPEGGHVFLRCGYISGGFIMKDINTVFITERDIFGERQKIRRTRNYKTSRFLSSYSDLEIGDYVVHVEYGVGVYKGISKMEIGGILIELLVIAYAGTDELYVPLDRIHLVQKYRYSNTENVTVNKMGGKEWGKAKASVKASLLKVAGALAALYSKRSSVQGFSAIPDNHLLHEFEANFEFEETPDQLAAIAEVKADMESNKVMDRLVCGDVGYGKTEVALRAAFKAVISGKQVAVLVPTTILAQQHYKTFTKRLEPFPVNIGIISRFCTAKEKTLTISEIASGKTDIAIGTHSLLQKNIIFKDLGLLIVDEEQRFGVAHKEKLKKYRAKIDVLTLTATPIPRTLNMAFSGVRDLSIIDTPPEDRFAIHTEIVYLKDNIIKEAVEKELERGGQVFFVHNRVQNIEKIAGYLRKLLPDVRVAVAHGQMNEHVLEKIMTGFCKKEYDILLCTSIVESGLDIPNANTIFINRADMFGLAQLYQLRGRVGRSKHRAYAYLIIPPVITDLAKKRLKAIQKLSDLGSGFKLAAHDMEIRGIGNILGHKQHGKMMSVGFEMYCQMMEETIREARAKEEGDDEYIARPDTVVELNIDSQIPETYINDLNIRLSVYRKLALAESEEEIQETALEIADRFGASPQLVQNLIGTMYIKALAKDLFISKIRHSGGKITIDFLEQTMVKPENIIYVVGKYSSGSRKTSFSKQSLHIGLQEGHSDEELIKTVKTVLGLIKDGEKAVEVN